MAWYVDSSAVVKLLVIEAETDVLRTWWPDAQCWSSELLVAEVNRAALRLGVPAAPVDAVLDTVNLVAPSLATFAAAGRLQPASLRTLDAIHVVAALELEHDLEGLVTYDARQALGAERAGVAVISPGRAARWWA